MSKPRPKSPGDLSEALDDTLHDHDMKARKALRSVIVFDS